MRISFKKQTDTLRYKNNVLFKMLSHFFPPKQGGNNYEVWKYEHSPNLPEVFEQFPSVKVRPSFLLTELAILKPRYYSISSSPKMFPGEIHATVAVVEYRVRGMGWLRVVATVLLGSVLL